MINLFDTISQPLYIKIDFSVRECRVKELTFFCSDFISNCGIIDISKSSICDFVIEYADFKRNFISSDIQMDRTNHYNIFQDDFRYAPLDIKELSDRVTEDSSKYQSAKVVIDLTHCDEMDRVSEFKKCFNNVKTYDKALI